MQSSASSQNSENRVASIVMVVVTLFVICNITETIFWMLAMGSFSVTGMTLMTCLNSSVNAVVYGVFNEKYRKLFRQLFLPCIKKEKKTTRQDDDNKMPKKSQNVVAGEEISSKIVKTSSTNV